MPPDALWRLGPHVAIFAQYRAWPWLLPLAPPRLALALAAMRAECARLGESLGAVELNLVADSQIMACNAAFLGLAGPTNILSFPGETGSLVLSLDTFRRECLLYAQPPQNYLLTLLAHGFGHLAGYDHSPRLDLLSAACLQKGANVLSCAAC